MALLEIKNALKEIFTAKMVVGQSLYGFCDGILISTIQKLPSTYFKYIILGDFSGSDIRTGDLKDKYRIFNLQIWGCAVVRDEMNAEEDAEYYAYALVKKIRTILKNNLTLISTSYPSGLAKRSFLSGDFFDFFLQDDVISACDILTLSSYFKEST